MPNIFITTPSNIGLPKRVTRPNKNKRYVLLHAQRVDYYVSNAQCLRLFLMVILKRNKCMVYTTF